MYQVCEFTFGQVAMDGFGAEASREGAGGDEVVLLAEQQTAELALVVVAQFQAAVQPGSVMRVLDRRLFRLPDAQVAGHTEVHDESLGLGVAVQAALRRWKWRQRHHDVLAAPSDGRDDSAA